MKTVGEYIAIRRAAKRAYEARVAFDDGHGRQLRIVKTKRGVRLHIEDVNRSTNANIVLHPDDVAWLVGRISSINGGKNAQRARKRSLQTTKETP